MTTKELSTKTGIKLSRLSQLTKGFRKGDRFYPPVLIENLHFKRNYGRIDYYQIAVDELTKEKR